MNRLFLILIIGLLSALGSYARETVKGTVTDSHGEPIPGVKVEIPGTSEFVFTDLDGAFQIILREPAKNLNFSYPGFGTATHRVRPEMNVILGKGWSGHEKGYRGMVDIEGGIGINGKATFVSGTNQIKDFQTLVLTGLTFTNGYQFNRHLFVGIGMGAYLDITQKQEIEGNSDSSYENAVYSSYRYPELTGITIPLFIAARWDFGLTKKTAPYIGLRFGITTCICTDDYVGEAYSHNADFSSRLEMTQEFSGSLFVSPTIGYRMTLYKKFGIDLGLSYLMGRRKHLFLEPRFYNYNDGVSNSETLDFFQRTSDVLLFNIGFDF